MTVARLAAWSAVRGWKFTHIVLARGRTPSQPMLTLRGHGGYEEPLRTCRRAAEELRGAGFPPVRLKIEVAPWDPVVPRSDEEARLLDGPAGRDGRYFEHHLMVLIDPVRVGPAACLDAITATAVAHGAHVSWNVRRTSGGS